MTEDTASETPISLEEYLQQQSAEIDAAYEAYERLHKIVGLLNKSLEVLALATKNTEERLTLVESGLTNTENTDEWAEERDETAEPYPTDPLFID